MARCLVVGGNGFLGSYIVDELVARGHEVAVFDRFSGPTAYAATDVERIVGDFLDPVALRAAVAGREFIFHFLSTTSPATADDDPSLDVRTNVAQSIRLFEFAVEAGVSRLYFASTGGAMYGETGLGRLGENAVPAPMSPYAIGKLAIEGYLRYFRRKHGLASVSYRLSNPYGPRQHPGKKQGVIPIFLSRIAQGQSLELYGDGSTVRDYIFAPDAARMIADTIGREPAHVVYNIGSGQGTTLNQLVDLAREVTGRDVQVRHALQPATFVDHVVLDTDRYLGEFGTPAFVSLSAGMALTWRATLEQRK